MKPIFTRALGLLLAISFFTIANAQQRFFKDIPESASKIAGQKRTIVPDKYRTLQLDTTNFLVFLRSLPSEQNITDRNATPIFELPMPDGSFAKFHVWESSVMAPELAAAYPGIKTFTGQGINDRTATIKFDWTEFGFHAMVLSPVTGEIFIDPYAQLSLTNYISYFRKDYKKQGTFQELPPIKNQKNLLTANPNQILAGACIGTQLRTYRLAVACTHEYAIAATGLATPTKGQTLAKVVTSVTRVNGIYETEASIRMVLVANDTLVLFPTAATDPFTGNSDANTLINQSQTQIDSRIGSANYDIGHTFSTGTAGLAGLGVVCIAGSKANGVTGIASPVGDAYDVDFVSHEMGHQFGADHSFNNANSCGTTASDQNAEPGSGVSIMGYAGVCSNDNLSNHSIPYFHPVSFDKIIAYSNTSSGNSCAVITATGNTSPVVDAGANYTIPLSTPFILTGTATDVNSDAITYDWEQVDVGGPTGASTAPTGNAPLFRSFAPVITGVRYFPRLTDVIGNTVTIGERLPSYARTMKFRLTARDNRAGGGGVCSDENLITVASSGPFTVVSPSSTGITWYVNDFQTVLWNVNGTTAAPVSCANVSIQLSTDGGNTFPTTLIASTPNDGSAEIQVPAIATTATARIRVMAVDNVFYDMSNANFTVQPSPTATFSFNSPSIVAVCSSDSGTAILKTGSLNNFTTAIALSASLNPAGTTVVFGTTSLAPGNSTTVSLRNTSSLAPGTYTVRVTGTAGAITKTKDIQFLVGGGAAAPAVLTAPANDATGLSVLPSFNWPAVSGATSYTLEISTVTDFSTIAQTVTNINSLPYSLATPLLENTTYYWRVKTTNSCGTGSASAIPNRFKTGISSCKTSTDVPKVISATGVPTVTSTIVIPAAAGVVITDINVTGINTTHSYISDLTFTLKGPNNVSVVLANGICDGYSDFNLSFDTQSATTYANLPCPPTDGTVVRPFSSLAVFNGINSTGTWSLIIKDNANGDGGTLNSWGLNINGTTATGCTITATPLATTYTFTGNGNWDVPANWGSGVVPPNPLPSGAAIIINHAAGGNCTLNVPQTISVGATLTVLTGKNLIVPGTLTVQ